MKIKTPADKIVFSSRDEHHFGITLLESALQGTMPEYWLELLPPTEFRIISLRQASRSMQSSRHAHNRRWDFITKGTPLGGFAYFGFYPTERTETTDVPEIASEMSDLLWGRLLARKYTAEAIDKTICGHPAATKLCVPSLIFTRIKPLVMPGAKPRDMKPADPMFITFFERIDAEFRKMTLITAPA